jgi:hypothetical protein
MTMTADERHQAVATLQADSPDVAKHKASAAAYNVRLPQVNVLVGYYAILLVAAVALLVFLILNESTGFPPLLAMMGFAASGAMVGSVLYQMRMLFRYYIKENAFDSRWLAKYVSGPWEAVALALVVLSLLQAGGVVLGGTQFDLTKGPTFSTFGIGALVGFGIREVVGWLGNLARTTFPTDHSNQSP